MNYCSIEDAWKNNEAITEQFKIKKNTLENIIENFSETNNQNNFPENIQENVEELNQNNKNTNYNLLDNNNNHFNDIKFNNFDYNLNNNEHNNNLNYNHPTQLHHQIHQNINKKNHQHRMHNTNNPHNYQNTFICDDFLDHLESCKICRMKMRNRFRSKFIEKFDNLVLDNKDTILIFLVILFALIFCNLIISIFK